MRFAPLTREMALESLHWRYEAPYDFYNAPPDQVEPEGSDPKSAFYGIVNEQGELLASCHFGRDAQVRGGDYRCEALDVGIRVRPDLTGRGQGAAFGAALLEFTQRTFAAPVLRVTIAEFNGRSQRLAVKAGFRPVSRFLRKRDGMPFVVMVRESREPSPNRRRDLRQ